MPLLQRLGSVDAALGWFARRGVRGLATDSRAVAPGDAFIAWPGHAVDARRFVGQALASGAAACLVEADGAEAFELGGGIDAVDAADVANAADAVDAVAGFSGLKAASGVLASAFMGAPSRRLDVLAVTGTNGKTSVAWWLAQALGALGRRCGLIGTLGIGEVPSAGRPGSLEPTGMTTPDPVALQAGLKRFADAGMAACAVEATSIGLVEERLAGTCIDVALFTNFTQDHLDFHGSMEAYWQAKARLFDWPGLRAAVLNVDDERGAALAERLGSTSGLGLWTYSARSGNARLRAGGVRQAGAGLAFEVREGDRSAHLETGLIGDYNASNLLAVIGGLRALGIGLDDALRACAELTPVPGRMQRVAGPPDQPQIVVDYAHTPDALDKALRALRPFARQQRGALWCVFGCGGNRDAAKRPLMGALAARLADHLVVTSDNPRHEPAAAILAQIAAGAASVASLADADADAPAAGVELIENRADAIAHAVARAAAADVILIAGKGHEEYQDAGGVRRPFSDTAQARSALDRRAAGACRQ